MIKNKIKIKAVPVWSSFPQKPNNLILLSLQWKKICFSWTASDINASFIAHIEVNSAKDNMFYKYDLSQTFVNVVCKVMTLCKNSEVQVSVSIINFMVVSFVLVTLVRGPGLFTILLIPQHQKTYLTVYSFSWIL